MSNEASVEGLPPWPVGARPEEIFELSCIAYDTSLIAALRARLALAVQWLEKVDLPLRYEEAEALIEALKEPSHG